MVICVFVWHSEWSWDVVSTCVDFSFEGLAPLRHPSLLGGRAWARQAAGLCRVFLSCCWHDVIEKSMFQVSGLLSELGHGLSPMWVQFQSMVWHKSNPCVLRIIPYHLQVTSFLSRSKWMGNPALKRTRWKKMSCVHVATRVVQKTPLTEQAKFKSSKWHSTAPNKKATSPDIGQLSHEISRTVELRQNCIWSSITVEHGAWQERMICAWDMWKRGAIFMAKFQTSSTTQTAGKPLANPILRNFHHVPNSLSEYAGHSISNPACFGASCTVLCSVMFISFKVWQRNAEKVRGGVDEPATWRGVETEISWKNVAFRGFFHHLIHLTAPCRCLQAVVQIEKRFQSRLRRRRALLEARNACSQRFDISGAGIRWYQMVSGVGHLDISWHISTMLQIVICFDQFWTLWSLSGQGQWALLRDLLEGAERLRQISTQFKRLKRFKRAQNAGDSDHHSHLLLRRQNLGLRGVFFSRFLTKAFPGSGRLLWLKAIRHGWWRVQGWESWCPSDSSGPWVNDMGHGAWQCKVRGILLNVDWCWLLWWFSSKHKLLTFIDWHYWHWGPIFCRCEA